MGSHVNYFLSDPKYLFVFVEQHFSFYELLKKFCYIYIFISSSEPLAHGGLLCSLNVHRVTCVLLRQSSTLASKDIS